MLLGSFSSHYQPKEDAILDPLTWRPTTDGLDDGSKSIIKSVIGNSRGYRREVDKNDIKSWWWTFSTVAPGCVLKTVVRRSMRNSTFHSEKSIAHSYLNASWKARFIKIMPIQYVSCYQHHEVDKAKHLRWVCGSLSWGGRRGVNFPCQGRSPLNWKNNFACGTRSF